MQPDPAAIFSLEPIFLVESHLFVEQILVGFSHPRRILAVDATQPESGVARAEFRLVEAEQCLHFWTEIHHPTLLVGSPGHIGNASQNPAEFFLALPERFLVPLGLSYILDGNHKGRPA